ncbi:hypothetical protein N3K66_001474 [Trichothecium roseum]|uniref:Uncharacterized protein n=1 Tax=Trichothecium roseum TaxID=47278 RepID=A0ACC0VET7_9HYPO|nr:hypothetical protein N3K66_001474 [Trichothecium roseum]
MATTADVELGIPMVGYPALANWIAADPDNETYIFRKFNRLAARNLLYLQSELCALEESLEKLEEGIGRDISLIESARMWEIFVDKANDEKRPEWEWMKLRNEIKEKLKEYHEALILQSSIIDLRTPRRSVLRQFQDWFKGGARGSQYSIISGQAEGILDDVEDLAALRLVCKEDMLSRFVQDHWPLKGRLDQRTNGSSRYFHLRHVNMTVALISTLVAAFELIGPILGLYFATDKGTRLGMIAAFTVLFALSLRLLSNASRAEIFGASAAYAAVLVVFVSSDLGGS